MLPINLIFNPPIIAHRGVSLHAPENTLAAFRKAKESNVHWIELDVMLTVDGEVVIIHDELLDRTTNGIGLVEEHSYAAIKILDSGSWFNAAFSAEKVPTLREALALCKELALSVNIEIKSSIGREEKTVIAVNKIVTENISMSSHVQILISSFSLDVLRNVRKINPHIALGFLMHEWNDEWALLSEELNCLTINVNQDILTPENCQAIKASQRLLLAYTVNDKARAQQLFALGVDAVFSDDPATLLNI